MLEFTANYLARFEAKAKEIRADDVKLAAVNGFKPEVDEILQLRDNSLMGKTTQNGYGYWMGAAGSLGKDALNAIGLYLAVNNMRDDLIGLLDGLGAAIGQS